MTLTNLRLGYIVHKQFRYASILQHNKFSSVLRWRPWHINNPAPLQLIGCWRWSAIWASNVLAWLCTCAEVIRSILAGISDVENSNIHWQNKRCTLRIIRQEINAMYVRKAMHWELPWWECCTSFSKSQEEDHVETYTNAKRSLFSFSSRLIPRSSFETLTQDKRGHGKECDNILPVATRMSKIPWQEKSAQPPAGSTRFVAGNARTVIDV